MFGGPGREGVCEDMVVLKKKTGMQLSDTLFNVTRFYLTSPLSFVVCEGNVVLTSTACV